MTDDFTPRGVIAYAERLLNAMPARVPSPSHQSERGTSHPKTQAILECRVLDCHDSHVKLENVLTGTRSWYLAPSWVLDDLYCSQGRTIRLIVDDGTIAGFA